MIRLGEYLYDERQLETCLDEGEHTLFLQELGRSEGNRHEAWFSLLFRSPRALTRAVRLYQERHYVGPVRIA